MTRTRATSTFDFSGSVVLVTGGGSGIGRATAEAFGRAGAQVAVADVAETHAKATVDAIREAGGAAELFLADVTSEAAVDRLVDRVVAHFGRLDIAHNNAGAGGGVTPLAEVSTEEWRRVIDTDLTSVFLCLKAEIPAMLDSGGGAIVNTASALGLIGAPSMAAYTAAKHGVVGLTRAAALDYARRGIRVNAVCPGVIDTPLLAGLPKGARDQMALGAPLGRLGQPDEAAAAVLWLCSGAASYVTGHALPVDGGAVPGGAAARFGELG